MAGKEKAEGMLSPYRVLDLTGEIGLFCGKLLGDLGADVIKIEPPGGDPARNVGPFYHDEPDLEKSLFWFAFNTSKRGITLNIETADGQGIFKKLVKSADFVLESFPPRYMDKLGLGYSELEKINPGIIMVSITNFGQTGPYRDYKAPDIVAWALGGQMYPWGDADRPPVRISYHSHAHLHTASEAAVGAVMALYYRRMTGEGQQIFVSVLDSSVQATWGVTAMWDMVRRVQQRGEPRTPGVTVNLKNTWPCKDGLILWNYSGARDGVASRASLSFVRWLEDEGFADDFIRGFDWSTFETSNTTQEIVDRLEERAGKFFRSRTKMELFDAASRYEAIELYPIADTRDVMESVQLAAREFFVELEHPELGTSITYPGGFMKTTEASPRVSRRAPLIGEHNQEIYEGELGISREELAILKQTNVI